MAPARHARVSRSSGKAAPGQLRSTAHRTFWGRADTIGCDVLLRSCRSRASGHGGIAARGVRRALQAPFASVYAYCARRTGNLDLAEDLTSVVFLEAFRRRRKLQLSNASALPWLLGVANNVSRNSDRSVRRYRSALDRLPAQADNVSSEDNAIERIGAQEALARALEAISTLTRGEQDVVLLVLWSELTYADAATALGIPVGTVRSRLATARAKFNDRAAVTSTPSPHR